MINQQLQDWVKEQLQQGVSKEGIRQMLKNTGWQDSDIEQVVPLIEGSPNLSNIPPPTPDQTTFLGPWKLFKKSLTIYRQRFWTLLGIYLIPIVPLLVLIPFIDIAKNPSGGFTPGLVIILILAILLGAVELFWVPVAILCAIRDREMHIGIKESYRQSGRIIWSYIWIGLLIEFVVLGGFILLIIPAIIFLGWFILSPYILVSENVHGMAALMKSREYIRGRWWGVFGRSLFLLLIILLTVFIVTFILGIFTNSTLSNQVTTIVGQVLKYIIMPLGLIYMSLIYENLRDIKGVNVVVTSKKGWFIFFGWLGGLVIPLLIAATVILLSLGSAEGLSRDATRSANLSFLQIRAELYFSDHNRYPLSLNELAPYSNSALPTDPTTHAPYSYTTSSDGSNYKLCATTEANVEKCIDKNGSL